MSHREAVGEDLNKNEKNVTGNWQKEDILLHDEKSSKTKVWNNIKY